MDHDLSIDEMLGVTKKSSRKPKKSTIPTSRLIETTGLQSRTQILSSSKSSLRPPSTLRQSRSTSCIAPSAPSPSIRSSTSQASLRSKVPLFSSSTIITFEKRVVHTPGINCEGALTPEVSTVPDLQRMSIPKTWKKGVPEYEKGRYGEAAREGVIGIGGSKIAIKASECPLSSFYSRSSELFQTKFNDEDFVVTILKDEVDKSKAIQWFQAELSLSSIANTIKEPFTDLFVEKLGHLPSLSSFFSL